MYNSGLFVRRTLYLFLFLFFYNLVSAQTPVQVTPQLLPPYSLQVSEYYSGVQPKLQVLLLNRDINQPTIQVKLKLTVESQNCRMQTKVNANTPTFTLTSGIPYYMTPQDLQPFFTASNIDFGGGYSEQEYVQTGRLPEGLYSFYIEAFELLSGNLVSNKGFTLGWLTLADPPILNTPARAESVSPTNPQNVIFNWTPRHNTSPTAGYFTDYIFTLVEYNDVNIGPEASFTSSPPFFIDSTQTTTYLFGPGQPQLIAGKRYAWRVQAKAKNGGQEIAMFRNNGFSEVFWFTYQNNCLAPLGISHTVQGQRATIEWSNNPQHMEWKVEYREKNNPDAQWFTIGNTLPRVMLTDLKPATEYEYRVGGSCIVGQFTYSGLYSFTTGGSPVPPVPNCGDSTLPAQGSGQLLQTLNAGDTIRAGSFAVHVGFSAGAGSFTGMGYVIVPWLMNAKVEVRFTNITLSLDRKLLSGIIETTYDPNESGIADIDEYIDIFTAGNGVGGVITGQVTADTTVGFPILWPGGIVATLPAGYDSTTGRPAPGTTIPITITNAQTGAQTTLQVDQLPTTIMDANGNVYQVATNGSVSLVAQSGGAELLQNMSKKVIDGDKALVIFGQTENAKYAFDKWQPIYKKSSTFSKEYEKIACVNGGLSIDAGNYYVSAKAMAPGATDTLIAIIRKPAGSTINKDSIQFINSKGTKYTRVIINDSTVAIPIVGGPEKDAQEIYAVYKQTDAKNLNLGKVLVASYPRKEFKVKLVHVSGIMPDKQRVKDSLTQIFGKININFNVTDISNAGLQGWDLNNNGLDVRGSSFFSSFTQEMKLLNKELLENVEVAADELVIFVLNSASDTTVFGDMPRGQRFGYLFTNNNPKIERVIAHEIGHGKLSLKHTKEYGFVDEELNNLMDYPVGNMLVKHQWDICHDPAIVLRLFSNDESGMYQTGNYVIADPGQTEYNFMPNQVEPENNDPDYLYIYAQTGIGYKVLKSKISGQANVDQYGFLISFTIQATSKKYISIINVTDSKFDGYYDSACIAPFRKASGKYDLSAIADCKKSLEGLGFIVLPNVKADNVNAVKKFWQVHKNKLINDNPTLRNDIIQLLQQLPPLAISFTDKVLGSSDFDLQKLKKLLEDKLAEIDREKNALDVLITNYYNILKEKAADFPENFEASSQTIESLKQYYQLKEFANRLDDARCKISTFFYDICHINGIAYDNYETDPELRNGAAILQSLTIDQRKKILNIYYDAPTLTSTSWGVPGPNCFWANFGEEIVVAMLRYGLSDPEKTALLNMFLSKPQMLPRFYKKIDNSHFYIGGGNNFDLFVKEIIKLAQRYDAIYNFSEGQDHYNYVWNPKKGFGEFELFSHVVFDDDYNMQIKKISVNIPGMVEKVILPVSLLKGDGSAPPISVETTTPIDPWKPVFLTLLKPDPSYFPNLPLDEAQYPISIQMPAIAFASLVNKKTNKQIEVTADVVFTVVSAGSLAAAKNGFQFVWRATQLLIASTNTFLNTSEGYNVLVRLYKKWNPNLTDGEAMAKAADLQAKWGLLSTLVDLDIIGEGVYNAYKNVREEVAKFNTLTNLGDDAKHLDDMRFAMRDFESGLSQQLKTNLASLAGSVHSWFVSFKNTTAGQWLTSLVSKKSVKTTLLNNGTNTMQYFYNSKKYNQSFLIAEVKEGGTNGFLFEIKDNGVPANYNKYSVEEPTDLRVIDNVEEGAAIVCEGGTCGIRGGGCLTAGTKVHTKNGTKSIETLEEGDLVQSYDSTTRQNILSRVSSIAKRGMGLLRKVIIGNDTIIATPNHRFYTRNGWHQAAQLAKGSLVWLMSVGWQSVDTVMVNPEIEDVYNIEVEGTHNFYVGNKAVLVHNGLTCSDKIKTQKLISTDVEDLKGYIDEDAFQKLEDEIVIKQSGLPDDLGTKVLDIQEKSKQLNRRLTFPELKTLWERGNKFNSSGNRKWGDLKVNAISEVHLVGSKNTRLDTWVPPGKNVEITLLDGTKQNYSNGLIISRKATTLSEIQLTTFKNYLKEVTTKYYDGKTIRSSKTSATVLKGDYFLEIPSSNKSFLQNNASWRQAAADEGIVLIFADEL